LIPFGGLARGCGRGAGWGGLEQRQRMGMALASSRGEEAGREAGRWKGQHRRQEAILEASRRREASAPTREAEATGGDQRPKAGHPRQAMLVIAGGHPRPPERPL